MLRVTCNVNRKAGTANYGSLGASVECSFEVDDSGEVTTQAIIDRVRFYQRG